MGIAYIQDPQKAKDLQKVREFFINYGYGDKASNTIVGEPLTPDVSGSVDAVFRVDTGDMEFFGTKFPELIDILGRIDRLSFENAGEDHLVLTITIKDVWKKTHV